MVDEFSRYYAEFLTGAYDCLDRIVLNGYFRLAHSPGSFRTWWRTLKGSDADLDNAHLMRIAGRVSRRVRAYAQAAQIPLIDCAAGERKDELAQPYLPTDPTFVGVFLILVGRAPAPVWDVKLSSQGKIRELAHKPAHVNHYAFHIMDPEWGHVIFKMCGHPPFALQIIINGHEYVARQAHKEQLSFTKEDNCFTMVADGAQLARIADTLCSENTVGHLSQLCDRWAYSACLCFALDLAEQQQSGFHYDYSLYQVEYSRNLLFASGHTLDQVFQGVVERTRGPLDLKTLKTIFGSRSRPRRRARQPRPRVEAVLETPTYDLTVFKLHFGKLTAKMYTKGEHVLRSEVIVHNVQALAAGRALAKFNPVVTAPAGHPEPLPPSAALYRYLLYRRWRLGGLAHAKPSGANPRRRHRYQQSPDAHHAASYHRVSCGAAGLSPGRLGRQSLHAVGPIWRSLHPTSGGLRSQKAPGQEPGGQGRALAVLHRPAHRTPRHDCRPGAQG